MRHCRPFVGGTLSRQQRLPQGKKRHGSRWVPSSAVPMPRHYIGWKLMARMKSRAHWTWCCALAIAAISALLPIRHAQAASRRELTWWPCGAVRFAQQGEYKIWFPLPKDYQGVIPHPIVLVGFYKPDKFVTPIPASQSAATAP